MAKWSASRKRQPAVPGLSSLVKTKPLEQSTSYLSLFSYIIFTKSRSNIQYKKTFSDIVLKIINIP